MNQPPPIVAVPNVPPPGASPPNVPPPGGPPSSPPPLAAAPPTQPSSALPSPAHLAPNAPSAVHPPLDPPAHWAPPTPPAGYTARSLLFDTHEQADTALQADTSKATNEAVGKLSAVTRKVAQREIRKAIVDVLGIGIGGVVQRGFQRHDALVAAGHRTLAGGREIVVLADHTTKSTHTPHVSLSVNGIDLGTITIMVVMTFRLLGITAVVERGQMVGLEAGSIVATGKLSVEEVPITTRSQTFDAVTAIKFDTPLPLVAAKPDAHKDAHKDGHPDGHPAA